MKHARVAVLLFIMALSAWVFWTENVASAQALESEDDWNKEWCKQVGGVAEYILETRQRVDCYDAIRGIAWEMDWAKSPKYLECLGQALSYARQTGFDAGCVLIVKRPKDCIYFERLWADVFHYDFKIRIATIPLSCDWDASA